jgi:hypothetical protein
LLANSLDRLELNHTAKNACCVHGTLNGFLDHVVSSHQRSTNETVRDCHPCRSQFGRVTTATPNPFKVTLSVLSVVLAGGSNAVVWSTYSTSPPVLPRMAINHGQHLRSQALADGFERLPNS